MVKQRHLEAINGKESTLTLEFKCKRLTLFFVFRVAPQPCGHMTSIHSNGVSAKHRTLNMLTC